LVLNVMDSKEYLKLVGEIVEGGMLCAGRLAHITHYVLQCGQLPGDMAEFGCHMGRTAALMAMLVDKPLYLYDSFDGLPDRKPQDETALPHFKRGSLAVGPEHLQERFEKLKLREPIVYKAWFNAIPKDRLPEQICFAHLDGDLYDSVRDSLRLVYPRLVRGGVCIVDDYGWYGTGGVKIAVDEYLLDKPEKAKPLPTGNEAAFQAVIVKL